jgi:hypothetical protein
LVAVAIEASPRQAAIGALCIGLGLMIFSGVMAKSCHDQYADANVAEGTVTSVDYGPLHVTVQYTNANGETVSFPDNTAFGRKFGERVPVKYFAHDSVPNAITADFNGMYGTEVEVAGFGLLWALGGTTGLAILRRRAKRRALEAAALPGSASSSTLPRAGEHTGVPAVEVPMRRGRRW